MKALLTVALLVAVAGCGGSRGAAAPADPEPQPITLSITGAPDMNRGNAVTVRVYALLGTTGLMRATLEELWASEASVLGDDLVTQAEVRLFPGETRALQIDVEGASHVAVVANLREPARGAWRHVFEASVLRGGGASVTIAADRVVAQGR